jgi:hypothetical protein
MQATQNGSSAVLHFLKVGLKVIKYRSLDVSAETHERTEPPESYDNFDPCIWYCSDDISNRLTWLNRLDLLSSHRLANRRRVVVSLREGIINLPT